MDSPDASPARSFGVDFSIGLPAFESGHQGQEDDFLDHLLRLPDAQRRKQTAQPKTKVKASSRALRQRGKDQISQLEKQQQLMLQKLQELTLQNQHLQDWSTVLKDIVQCMDEAEAVNAQVRSVAPELRNQPSHVEKVVLWNERVQMLTNEVFKTEIGGKDPDQALEATMKEYIKFCLQLMNVDDPADTATFLALQLHHALPLLKVSEEQHWATVAASLQLSPQQRSHALIAREVFLSSAATCRGPQSSVIPLSVAPHDPLQTLAPPASLEHTPPPLSNIHHHIPSHAPPPNTTIHKSPRPHPPTTAHHSPKSIPCAPTPTPPQPTPLHPIPTATPTNTPNPTPRSLEQPITTESLARLEQHLSLFRRRVRTMFHYIHTRLLTPLQAARAHVQAYPMLASPIALLNAIAMFGG